MSLTEAARFFDDCRASPEMMARFDTMPLPDILFAAKCAGYDFQVEDLSTLIGGMEVWRIMTEDGQEIGAESSLWLRMWGRSRLDYVVKELWSKMDLIARDELVAGDSNE